MTTGNDSKLPLIYTNTKSLQCNDIQLSKKLGNIEPLPLGERYPQLRKAVNTGYPHVKECIEHYGACSGCCPTCYKLKCVVCGQEFWAKRPDRKYCCYRCTNDAAIIRRRNWRKKQRNKICLFCRHPFTAQTRKAKFCCLAHRVAYFRQSKRNDSNLVLNDTRADIVTPKESEQP